jgi:hypothetical protein
MKEIQALEEIYIFGGKTKSWTMQLKPELQK